MKITKTFLFTFCIIVIIKMFAVFATDDREDNVSVKL